MLGPFSEVVRDPMSGATIKVEGVIVLLVVGGVAQSRKLFCTQKRLHRCPFQAQVWRISGLLLLIVRTP